MEACAYYIRLKGIFGDVDRLEMTQELVDLITERFKASNLEWAISSLKQYRKLLDDGMEETCNTISNISLSYQKTVKISFIQITMPFWIIVPDFDDDTLTKSKVLRYNFRSMIVKEVRDKELLCKSQKITSNDFDVNANKVCHHSTPPPKSIAHTDTTSASPHDFLKGDYFFCHEFCMWAH